MDIEAIIDEWHAGVNGGDPQRAADAVGDPVLVLGPRGAGAITPEQFAEWVVRSGIRLVPRQRHRIGDRLMVVEQDATWPGRTSPMPSEPGSTTRTPSGPGGTTPSGPGGPIPSGPGSPTPSGPGGTTPSEPGNTIGGQPGSATDARPAAGRPEPAPTRVATVFRVDGGKVTACLRFPDLDSALAEARDLAAAG